MSAQQFNFIVDNLILNGWIHLPPTPRPNLVIGSHGLLSTGSSPKQTALAEKLNKLGLAYVRFDHRGTGQSQGDFKSETTLPNRTRDLTAVCTHVRQNFNLGPKLGLFGSSLGGATCLNAFGQLKPNAVVTVAAPVASADILPRANLNDPNIAFLRNTNQGFNLQPKLAEIKNILVIHGTADEVVPCSQSDLIFNAAQNPKQLLLLPESDHTISDPALQAMFMAAAADWFTKYLL